MIHWCAYCQRFLREGPPYDDFGLSHGMCKPCKQRGLNYDKATGAKIKNLVSFQKKLWKLSASGDIDSTIRLIHQGIAQGIRAVDLLLGSVGAILYEASKVSLGHPETSDDSVRMDAFCARVVEATREKYASLNSTRGSAEVLLVTLTTNQHIIGVQLLEQWLNAEGISSLAIVNKSEAEVLAAVEQISPKVIGFSISCVEQLPQVRSLANRLKIQCELPPLMILGGYAVKTGLITDQEALEFALVQDESKLFLILKNHLSLGFLYDLKKRVAN